MLEVSIRFVGLLCIGLAAGIALCVFLFDRMGLGTGQFYTELSQLLIRALTVPAPALGALGLIAIAIDAVLRWKGGGGTAFWLDVAALALAIVAMAVTKFGHFPINDQVLQWDAINPPADWRAVRAKWSALHVARTGAAGSCFAFFLLSNLLRT